jgi:hypothetical protein
LIVGLLEKEIAHSDDRKGNLRERHVPSHLPEHPPAGIGTVIDLHQPVVEAS